MHPKQVARITEAQARAAVQRFANRHFNNAGEKSRASIPAAADDDDILLMDYITQREAAATGTDSSGNPANDTDSKGRPR